MNTPSYVQQRLNQAQQFLNQGKPALAEAVCRQVSAELPGEPHSLHMLGLIAYNNGDPINAIACLRQACLSPEAPALYHSNLTEMLRQQGLLVEAEQCGRKAVALDRKLASAWNNLGIVLQEAGKLKESLACLEKVVGIEPRSASAHNNMANTYKRLGNFSKAQKHWNRAIELNPNYAEPYSNLANMLNEQGQYDKAFECGQQALKINPRLADAYINLAATEIARSRYPAALITLDRLLSFAPDHALALAARATALKELDRLEEALSNAKRAVELLPGNAEVQNAYGLVLLALGRFEEAISVFDIALALPSAIRERLLISRAMAHQEIGESETALMELEKVLIEFPRSAAAWHGRADLVKFTLDDPSIPKMKALLGSSGVHSNKDRMAMQFALGKAFLDAGDSNTAFKYLNEGNRMKRALIEYDADKTNQHFADIASAYSPELFARFKGAGCDSDVPIFVIGMPRSGTTLLEQILASHAQIHGAGELRFLSDLVDQRGGNPKLLEGVTPEILFDLGQDYTRRISAKSEGRYHVVDKMPANFMFAGLIHLILPNARIIHSRRHPVDTCLSCYSKLFSGDQHFTYDMTELGRFYRDYQELMSHWRNVLPKPRFLEVDYEDVVADTEAQARRILDFLGLPWDPACLEFHKTRRAVRTASVNQVRQPVYTASTGRWKSHAENLQPLLDVLGGM